MKTTYRRMMSLLLVIMMIGSFCAAAYAEGSWTVYFGSGGSLYIPNGFDDVSDCSPNGSAFYNNEYDMRIEINESYIGSYGRSRISEEYDNYCRVLPDIVYQVCSADSFTLSGYDGRNIYYIQYSHDHGTLYTIEFYYPTANRRYCDPVVEKVCDSFTTTGYGCSYAQGFIGHPSPADLDAIHADVKYPNYDRFYLDHYITATITHKEVYFFKDPDSNVWRDGNYFTVRYGTEVTILAESQGYACVIINGTNRAGWVNCDYLSRC